MTRTMPILLVSLIFSCAVHAEEPTSSPPTTTMTDKERLDSLIRQNQLLTEDNYTLRSQCERPKTKEEAFAACMQAAKGGTSPMAAESIGGHCDQLLKK